MQARVWNGYLYYALKVFIPEKEAEAMWEGFPDSRRSAIPGAAAYWERAVDELQQLYRSIDAVDVDSAGATRSRSRGSGPGTTASERGASTSGPLPVSISS